MHTCPHPDCTEVVPNSMMACRPHWFKVPKELRQKVWQEYRRDPGGPAWQAAVLAAVKSMRSEGV